MEVNQKVRAFLGKFIDVKEVADEDNIFAKGLVNSLFAMQIVTFIENEFNLAVSNDELDIDNFKDIKSITALIESKVN